MVLSLSVRAALSGLMKPGETWTLSKQENVHTHTVTHQPWGIPNRCTSHSTSSSLGGWLHLLAHLLAIRSNLPETSPCSRTSPAVTRRPQTYRETQISLLMRLMVSCCPAWPPEGFTFQISLFVSFLSSFNTLWLDFYPMQVNKIWAMCLCIPILDCIR